MAKQKFDKSINKSSEYRIAIEALGGPEAASNAMVRDHIEAQYDGWEWGSNPAAAIGQVRKSMLSSAGKPVGRRTKKVAKKKVGRKKGTRVAKAIATSGSSSGTALAAALSFLTTHGDAESALAKAREIIAAVGPGLATEMAQMLGSK